MNYGGDAADQIVRYSLDGVDHGLRLSGTLAKHLAVFLAAVMKDQKKTRGRTRMVRMLKENKPLKFFTVPSDRLREFCSEGRKRGLLYVIIKDRKNPDMSEVMVFADDAAKVNRVMDKMNLDFVKSEVGQAVHEVTGEQEKAEVTKETVQMPEGEVQFEISELDEDFQFDDAEKTASEHADGTDQKDENFTGAQEDSRKNLSDSSLRSSDTSTGPAEEIREPAKKERPSVRRELENIKQEKQKNSKKRVQEKTKGPKKKIKANKKGR